MRPDLGAGEDGEDVHHVEHLLLQGEAGAQLPGCGHPRQGELHDHHEDNHSRKCDDDGQNPCFGELESARFSRTHVVGKVILEKKDDDLVVRFVAYLLSCSLFWAFFSPITCPETLIK